MREAIRRGGAKRPLKALLILLGVMLGLALAIVAIDWAAGAMVLAINKRNPLTATLSTWSDWRGLYDAIPQQHKRLKASMIVAVLVVIGLPLMAILAALRPRRELHGSARFANATEICKAGLHAPEGIIVGKVGKRFLHFGGEQFVLLAAPTRSGKGVGVAIPNLLTWDGSVVVLDIKSENFRLTSGFRAQHGQEIYLFCPVSEGGVTHRYNPLDYVRDEGIFRIGDITAIGHIIWPADAIDSQRFWNDSARNLFLGLVLMLLELRDARRELDLGAPDLAVSLGEVLRQSSGCGAPVKDYLTDVIKSRAQAGKPLSQACCDALYRFLNTSEATLASIVATFTTPLELWANPLADAATSASDFDLRDVRRRRMSIYLEIPASHLGPAGVLVNLLFSQLINLNTRELPRDNPELAVPCLLLMDEFTAIGRIGIVAKAIAYMAGYNLRLLIIIQSVKQLEEKYGREAAGNMMVNCAMQIVFAPRDHKDAADVSESLGYFTERATSKSRNQSSGGGKSAAGSSRGESVSEQRRALMMPQEVKEMGQYKAIIFLENCKPMLVDKVRYFDDEAFDGRVLPAVAVAPIDLNAHVARTEGRLRPITLADFREEAAPRTAPPELGDAMHRACLLKRPEDLSPEASDAQVAAVLAAFGYQESDLPIEESEHEVQTELSDVF